MEIELKKITFERIAEITHEFYDTRLIYRVNFMQLGKHFLHKVLDRNVWKESFEGTRKYYIQNSGKNEESVSTDESKFYSEIIEEYFGYDKEPRQELLESYQNATDHLREVDERISKIDREITEIRDRKNNVEIQEKIPTLSYFLSRNKEAREKILHFLKHDIYNYTLNQCDSRYRGIFSFGQIPYGYAWNPKAYDIRYPSMLSNKFGDLEVSRFLEVKKLFEEDKLSFQTFLDDYIGRNEILFSIRQACNENHILNKRAIIIDEALQAYESGKKIVFSSICAVIIEGIFHDVCVLLGADENNLLDAGFQEKVNFLQERLGIDFHYEYYAFKFRLLRNKMAHGLIDEQEAKEVSGLLLLDLYDAIAISKSIKVPLNQKRFFLHQALQDSPPDSYKYIEGYLLMSGVQIPDFYNTKQDQEKIIEILKTDKYWEHLDNMLNLQGDLQKAKAHTLLKIIKNLKNETLDERCVDRFKTITIAGLPKFNKQKFIEDLIQ